MKLIILIGLMASCWPLQMTSVKADRIDDLFAQMSVEDTPSFEVNTKVCLINLPVNITFDSLRSILCRKFGKKK